MRQTRRRANRRGDGRPWGCPPRCALPYLADQPFVGKRFRLWFRFVSFNKLGDMLECQSPLGSRCRLVESTTARWKGTISSPSSRRTPWTIKRQPCSGMQYPTQRLGTLKREYHSGAPAWPPPPCDARASCSATTGVQPGVGSCPKTQSHTDKRR